MAEGFWTLIQDKYCGMTTFAIKVNNAYWTGFWCMKYTIYGIFISFQSVALNKEKKNINWVRQAHYLVCAWKWAGCGKFDHNLFNKYAYIKIHKAIKMSLYF